MHMKNQMMRITMINIMGLTLYKTCNRA